MSHIGIFALALLPLLLTVPSAFADEYDQDLAFNLMLSISDGQTDIANLEALIEDNNFTVDLNGYADALDEAAGLVAIDEYAEAQLVLDNAEIAHNDIYTEIYEQVDSRQNERFDEFIEEAKTSLNFLINYGPDLGLTPPVVDQLASTLKIIESGDKAAIKAATSENSEVALTWTVTSLEKSYEKRDKLEENRDKKLDKIEEQSTKANEKFEEHEDKIETNRDKKLEKTDDPEKIEKINDKADKKITKLDAKLDKKLTKIEQKIFKIMAKFEKKSDKLEDKLAKASDNGYDLTNGEKNGKELGDVPPGFEKKFESGDLPRGFETKLDGIKALANGDVDSDVIFALPNGYVKKFEKGGLDALPQGFLKKAVGYEEFYSLLTAPEFSLDDEISDEFEDDLDADYDEQTKLKKIIKKELKDAKKAAKDQKKADKKADKDKKKADKKADKDKKKDKKKK